MAAGQGPGPYGDPPGPAGVPEQPDASGGGRPQHQPPYGQPPYGQPPYGQPPYGQPPYGQPPYPKYGAAPSAPAGFGAPRPVERPLTVRAGIGAFVASMMLSLVASVVSLLNRDRLMADIEADFGALPAGEAGTFGTVGFVVGLLFTAIFGLFVWFAWKGHNWARIVLWVLTGLGLLAAPFAFSGPLPILTVLTVFQLLADVVAVVLLALKPSNEWYRYRGWLRATGQLG